MRPCVGGGRARTAPAGRPRAALQSPVTLSAPVVVGDAHRRGLPPAVRGARTSHRARNRTLPLPRRGHRLCRIPRPVHRCANLHDPDRNPWRTRTGLPATGGIAVPGDPRGVGIGLRGGAPAGGRGDRRTRGRGAGSRGAGGRRTGTAGPLRKRGPAPGCDSCHYRGAVARPAAACAGIGGRTGCRGTRRRGRLAAGDRPTRPAGRRGVRSRPRAANARCRNVALRRSGGVAATGAAGRRTGRGGLPHRPLARCAWRSDRQCHKRFRLAAIFRRLLAGLGCHGALSSTCRIGTP